MQVDTPLKLYDKPVNLFVAGFIGSPQMNLIEATRGRGQGRDRRLPGAGRPGRVQADRRRANNITVGVRPEAWRLVTQAEGGLPVKVTVVEELGADAFVYGTSGVEGTPSNVIVRVSARDTVHKGDTIFVTTDPHHVHVFDTDTGERLSD